MIRWPLPLALVLTFGFIASTWAPIIGQGVCTSGGFSINRERTASIGMERCESYIQYELLEIIGRDGPRPIYAKHDSMKIQRTAEPWVAACHGDGPFFTGVIILNRRPINYGSPDILKAWKANLDTWSFESIDPTDLKCGLFPAPCGR